MIIHLKNINVIAYIGTHDWEKERKQRLIINLKFEFKGENAIKSDNISDTIDYEQLNNKIVREVTHSRYQLVEHLTGKIMELVMEDERIREAWLEIDKPEALQYCDSVSVSYYRKQT